MNFLQKKIFNFKNRNVIAITILHSSSESLERLHVLQKKKTSGSIRTIEIVHKWRKIESYGFAISKNNIQYVDTRCGILCFFIDIIHMFSRDACALTRRDNVVG